MSEPLVRATGLTKRYADLTVLDCVDIEARPGECLGITGPNGSGTSTLLGVLAGTIGGWGGEITRGLVDDPTVGHRPAAITLVPQELFTDPERGLAAVRTAVTDGSEVVLLDDVTAAFNAAELAELHSIIDTLTTQGRTVVHASHRLDELQNVADRVLVLRDGRLHDSTENPAADLTTDIHEAPVDVALPANHSRIAPALSVDSLSGHGFDDVTFSLAAGEVVGLVGSRRSGVQELAYALTGRMPAISGRLKVAGQPVDVTSQEAALRGGIAHHHPTSDNADVAASLLARLPASEDFTAAHTQMLRRLNASDRADERMERRRLGLSLHPAARTHRSIGQRRARQLRALLRTRAGVLVLEEPTATLDEMARQDFYADLDRVTAAGIAVVLLSADTNELLTRTQRLLVMHDGRLVDAWDTPTVTSVHVAEVVGPDHPLPAADPGARNTGQPPAVRDQPATELERTA